MTELQLSEIDRALAAARARKAQKEGSAGSGNTDESGTTSKRPRRTPEERAEAARAAEEARRLKAAARAEARAAKGTRKTREDAPPAHMRKVQKAAEKLGPLGQAAQLLFNEATTNLSAPELAVLALHIQHFNRVQATSRAVSSTISPGVKVRIVSGDPRLVGQTGVVVKAQRIRCYVYVEGGNNRPVPGLDGEVGVYFFTSDVEPLETEEAVSFDAESLDGTPPETPSTAQEEGAVVDMEGAEGSDDGGLEEPMAAVG